MEKKSVLIVGGTGYLGQFLVADFLENRGWTVAYTQHSSQQLPAFGGHEARACWVNIATGEGLQACVDALEGLDAVINCAAVSQPAMCEKDPAFTRSINVPTALLSALEVRKAQSGAEPLLIHLSTDQVYDGSKQDWKEDDPCEPVNEYGRSKLLGEQEVARRWPRHVNLRSSLIYGPGPPGAPVGRPLFLQFVDGALASGKPTTFFEDEFRSAVYVGDIVGVCGALIERPPPPCTSAADSAPSSGCVFNMGGPERLSRVDIARAVAVGRGYDQALIEPVPAASVNRGVVSPPDISMDSTRLWQTLGLTPTKLAEGVLLSFPPAE